MQLLRREREPLFHNLYFFIHILYYSLVFKIAEKAVLITVTKWSFKQELKIMAKGRESERTREREKVKTDTMGGRI